MKEIESARLFVKKREKTELKRAASTDRHYLSCFFAVFTFVYRTSSHLAHKSTLQRSCGECGKSYVFENKSPDFGKTRILTS